MYTNISKRADGSYVIDVNGNPYHIPNEGEWVEEWIEVNAYALEHPEELVEEKVPEPEPFEPYVPTEDDILRANAMEFIIGIMEEYNND
jgi:hypothetical protein